MAPVYLASGVNDIRLIPRLLRSLTRDLDDTGDRRSRLFNGEELANILEKVQFHGLLSELLPEDYVGKDEVKQREEWRLAVDAWVERLLLLVLEKMPQKCWAGTCLLGVTIEECTSERLIASYSVWFEKLLQNIQASSNNSFVNEASYACLSDLFTRLYSFPIVKKESTSFSRRLVQPILQLMDGDGSFMEAAIDLLCALIKFYPSSIYRCYDKVEAALASKIMSGNFDMEVLKKISGAFALLPHTKGDNRSWVVYVNVFEGIEEGILLFTFRVCYVNGFVAIRVDWQRAEIEGKGLEIMKLLVPAGKEAPPLWDQINKPEANTHTTRRLRNSISPLLCSLTYSCCIMLTNSYPVQVNIPVRPLLALIGRVLNVDGTLVSKTVLPSTTSLYQELLCSELPSFHLYILDLLIATIKGLKSQLLPHAASIVQPVTDYFRRATLPSIRAKVYYTLELLLHSMGVGMSLCLAEHVVSNASIDLDEGHESFCISKLGNEASLKSSLKKRKRGRSSSQFNGIQEETNSFIAGKKSMPLSVKIAALRAMETLLSVGGSLKSESWRLEADRLLINVATKSLDTFTGEAGKYLCIGNSATSQDEYCLVALQALLSSLLSPSHVRPPYLSQGLELFKKGKLVTGTEVATFCKKALLALEVLIHPRDIPLVSYPIPVAAAVIINEFDDEEMYPGWWGASDDEIQTQPQSMEVNAPKSEGVEQERREDNREAATISFQLEKNESGSVSPPELGSSRAQAAVDLLPSQDLQNTGSDTKYAVSQDAVEARQSKISDYDLLVNNNLKGEELMNDSDAESHDSAPHVVDFDSDTHSD